MTPTITPTNNPSLLTKTGPSEGPLGYGEPIVARSNPPQKKVHTEYIDHIRSDFWFTCAYCTCSEIESQGVGFNIDHYLPEKTHPQHSLTYKNLVYSCSSCNSAKRAYSPTSQQIKSGIRYIKCDEEDPRKHIEISDSFKPVPTTMVGELTSSNLRLDSLRLRRIRRARKNLVDAYDHMQFGAQIFRDASVIDCLPPGLRTQFLHLRREYMELMRKEEDEFTFEILAKSIDLDVQPDITNAKDYAKHLKTTYER